MNTENVLSYLVSFPGNLALGGIGAVLFCLILASCFRRSPKPEAAVKPRAISIETELQIDVKRRWKNRFAKQPFSRRAP